jgi:hypothetical protein
MIPQSERGVRAPRERYRLLYLKIFAGMLGDLSQGMALGTDLALRVAEIRSRAARLPSPDEINALEAAALAKRRETMTPTQIRGLAAEAIAHLHGVATYREMQAAAEAFYTGPWLDGIRERYGMDPQIKLFETEVGVFPAQWP